LRGAERLEREKENNNKQRSNPPKMSSRGRQRGVPLDAFLKENGLEEEDERTFSGRRRIGEFRDDDDDDDEVGSSGTDDDDDEESESDEEELDNRGGRRNNNSSNNRRGGGGGRRNRRYDDDDDEENFRALPPPKQTLQETENILARAMTEHVASSLTGEMPSKGAMEKLERALQKCVQAQKATAEDDAKRERLLNKLETMLQQKFDAVSIDPFGSFVSAFHTKNSDIDVSLTIHPSSQWYNEEEERKYRDAQSGAPRPRAQRRQHRTKRVQLLAKFASELRWRKYDDVQLIAHARVPLVKFRDPETGVACDVCVHNDGVYKSAVMGFVADHSSLYRDLVFCVKMWAKNWNVNDAINGTFNSYSLCLLALFTLQRHGICPPMANITLPDEESLAKEMQRVQKECEETKELQKPREVSHERKRADAQRNPHAIKPKADKYHSYSSGNEKMLAELFVDFFVTLSAVEPMWAKGLVASTYAGRWTCGCSWPLRKYKIGVEDPFASGDNVARAVQRRSAPVVFGAIRGAAMTVKRILWAENDEQFEMAMMDMLGDPERVHQKNIQSNNNRFTQSGTGGRGARERRETRRAAQRATDNTLNQPPPMPLPPMPTMQPPPLSGMGQTQQQQNIPPRLPPMPRNGANPPAGLQPTPPGMPPPLPLNQLQQQQQRESNLLAQMQSMNMNMNGHQMQQQQQQITKSIAELEQSVIQQAQQRQQIQQQEQMLRQQQQQRQQQQMQNSGGFGDELGGGIFSSIAKNTPSFGFGASPQPMIQQQPPLQQALFGGSGGSSEGSGLDIFGNPMPKNFNSAFEGLNNHNNNESLGNLFAQQQPLVSADDNDSPNGSISAPQKRDSRKNIRRRGGRHAPGPRSNKNELLNGGEGNAKSIPQPRQ